MRNVNINTFRLESTPAWIRTKDQLIKSQLLYQLSYRGMGVAEWLKGTCARQLQISVGDWAGKAKNFGHGATSREGAEWTILA